jgi:hypothetical protein
MSIKPPTPAEAQAVSQFFTRIADRLEPGLKAGDVLSEDDLSAILAETGLTRVRVNEIIETRPVRLAPPASTLRH